ncbi:MAG: hypothetical protein ACR2QF_09835, partial [Geminicoccaceae bacterium]
EPESIVVLWQETAEEAASLAANRTELDGIVTNLEKDVEEKRHTALTLMTRRQQVEERLATVNDEIGADQDGDGQIDEQLAEAEVELAAAQNMEKTLSGNPGSPSSTLGELETEIKKLRQQIDQCSRNIGEAKLKMERLRAKVSVRAGRGLDERIDECLRRLDVLTQEQARFQLDANALSLLSDTLTEAANDAKAHFHAPLAARLTPYLQSLLPDAELEVTPDFGIAAVHRGPPAAERFQQLSDGTREQIAVLARLAFAQMLQEQGLPSLVVLDDALVFSDQQRLARMFGILENAAKSLQIIILTCREDRFLDLKAKHLQLQQRATAA